jgi:hypothetical protein
MGLFHFTAPQAGEVYNGAFGELNLRYTAVQNSLEANWHDFRPSFAPLDHYELAIGSQRGLADIVPFADVGIHQSSASFFLDLKHGATYYQTIKMIDAAGLECNASGLSIAIDVTPPLPGFVTNNFNLEGADTVWQSETDIMVAAWDGFSDPESCEEQRPNS